LSRMSQTEIELKFPLTSPEETKRRLLELGFSSQGTVFELNIVFDTPQLKLASGDCLLRLRRDRKVKLTFKEPPSEADRSPRFKVKSESELELGDFETMRHILHKLGFTRERVYEKYREHFTRGPQVSAEIDQLPHMGFFLELEAGPGEIEAVSAALGLDPEQGLRQNYFQLFDEYCRKTGFQDADMRFADETRE